jgi:RHS repeat-associated protein
MRTAALTAWMLVLSGVVVAPAAGAFDSPAAASPAGPGPATPVLAGEASTFAESPPGEVTGDGRFRQSVPVAVPAFHNLTPAVGLVYDSRSGNGVAGWGWQLAGDSEIRRLSRGRGAPRMDASDDYALDGQRLIACASQQVKGVSCTAGGTHSTERETFRRITWTGSDWRVTDKDGTVSTYRSWSGTGDGAVFSLAERRNTHGDRVLYKRWCDGSACYLSEIEYVDSAYRALHTRITYFYEARPDLVTTGIGSALLETRQRLLTIRVSTGGAIRSALALSYAAASLTRGGASSRLDGVTRYGRDAVLDAGKVTGGTALPKETFGWQRDDVGDLAAVGSSPSGNGPPLVTDGGGPTYADASSVTNFAVDPQYYGSHQWLTGDVNGDGRDDVITVSGGPDYWNPLGGPPSPGLAVEVRLSDGKGGFTIRTQTTTWPNVGNVPQHTINFIPQYRLLVGDVNGDGRADLVNVWRDERTGTVQVLAEAAFGTPTGFLSQQGTATTGMTAWSPRARWFLGDQDGDGFADLIGVHGANGDEENGYANAGLLVARSDGKRFSDLYRTSTSWTFEQRDDPQWFVGDVDGDERADILGVEAFLGNATPRARLRLGLSRGAGTFTASSQLTSTQFFTPLFTSGVDFTHAASVPGELAHAGDFDGDGRTDLVLVQPVKPPGKDWEMHFTSVFYRHDGAFELVDSTVDLSVAWLNSYQRASWKEPQLTSTRWMTTDVDGDGRTDLVLEGPAAEIFNIDEWPTTVRFRKLLSRGDGTWTLGSNESTQWPVGCSLVSGDRVWCATEGPRVDATIGDVNGDGRGDVVVAAPEGNLLQVHARMSANTVTDLQRGQVSDVTGDGRPDWVYPSFGNPGLTVTTAVADPGAATGYRWVRTAVAGAEDFAEPDMRRWIVADLGSPAGGPDGRADLMYLHYDATGQELRSTILLSKGDGTYVPVDRSASTGETEPDVRPWIPVDANGDGLADLVRLRRSSTGIDTTTLLANGSGGWSSVPGKTSVPWELRRESRFRAADVDGDGWGDLVHVSVQIDPGHVRLERVLTVRSKGDGTWTAVGFRLPAQQGGAVGGWRPADLNGDGRLDLVRVAYEKAAATDPGVTRVDRLVSHGVDGFRPDSVDLGIADYSPGWNAIDENGDGCEDLVWVNSGWQNEPAFGFVRRVVNTCADMKPARAKLTTPLPAVIGWWPGAGTRAGTHQLVRMVPGASGPELAALPLGAAPRLIETADSGLGRRASLSYITSAGGQDNLPLGASPVVVGSLTLSGGAAEGSGTTTYTYFGMRWSYALQRMLGFGRVIATDTRRRVDTTYAQTSGCAGAVTGRIVRNPAMKALAVDATRYQDSSATGAAPWTCLPDREIRQQCDGFTDCRQIRSRLEYDTFGDRTVLDELGVFVDIDGDGNDDLVTDNRRQVTDYAPNTTAYLVSYPSRQRTETPDGDLVADRRWTYDANTSYLQPPAVGDARTVSAYESHLHRYLDTTFVPDAHGNVKEQHDPDGRVTTTTWDPTYARFAESVCNALWCTSTGWDTVLGYPTTETDANMLTTTTHWDALGRHERTDYPDGGCRVSVYENWGQVPGQRLGERTCVPAPAGSQADPAYLTRWYSFDGLHRVYRDERPGGATRTRTFVDATSLVSAEGTWRLPGQPGAGGSTYGYDALDRPVVTFAADKTNTQHSYGPGVVTESDQTNRSTRRYTDGLGRVVRVEEVGTGAPPLRTTLIYDALDQLVESKDGADNLTTRTVGSLGWAWQECDPDRGCLNREFDDAGRVTKETDAMGQSLSYGYDAIGRRDTKTYRDAVGNVTDSATWFYDKDPVTGASKGFSVGQVTATYRTSSDTRETRSYDKRGRVTVEEICVATTCSATDTSWDIAGRIASIRYPDGAGQLSNTSERVEYGYDDVGRVRAAGSYATTITYNADDTVKSTTFGNGVTETSTPNPVRGWTDSTTLTGMTGTVPTLTTTYFHDEAGRVTGENRGSPVPHQKWYGYDAIGRVKNETGSFSEAFTYDTLGRIDTRSGLGTYTYSDVNHLHAVTAAGSGSYTYDAAGRALTGPGRTYEWDGDGRLVGVTKTNAAATVRYGYDADGHRVVKDTDAGRTVYAGPLVEIDTFGEFLRTYQAGGRLIARSHLTWGVWYYSLDPQGSVKTITGDAGLWVQFYSYGPFGTSHPYQPGDSNEIRYAGARQDRDTGLLALGARDYDPALGRFLAPDSVVPDPLRATAYDHYAYGYNDPVNTVDPTGHAPDDLLERASGVSASTSPRSARLLGAQLTLQTLSPEDSAIVNGAMEDAVGAIKGGLRDLVRNLVREVGAAIIGNRNGTAGTQYEGAAGLCFGPCYGLFVVAGGYAFTPPGPEDWLFGQFGLFWGVGGSVLGLTPGPKDKSLPGLRVGNDGPYLSQGIMAGAGVSEQRFWAPTTALADVGGWAREHSFSAWLLSGGWQTDPESRLTLMGGAGLDVGVPASAVAYNSYAWTWQVW